MNTASKSLAWICIYSTLFMGCYSSALISPTGEDKDKMYSGRIESIITKDGLKYEFDIPPVLSNGAFVGVDEKGAVSIPLSEVSEVHVTKFDIAKTGFLVLLSALLVLILVSPPSYSKPNSDNSERPTLF
jgi:hypothetical protein